MKQLTCEMCGSTDLLKQDGVFVCQTCGTKYSVEEAKKMMIEGTVNVSGTVKVDNTDKIKNYLEMAKSAYDAGNKGEAESYCNRIIEIEPQNPEAWFMKGKAAGWQSTLANIRIEESVQCFSKAIDYADDEEKEAIQKKAADEISELSLALISLTCSNFAESPTKSNAESIRTSAINTINYTRQLLVKCGVGPSTYKHQAAMKMNDAAVTAYSKCVLPEYLEDHHPADWRFKNYLTQSGFCLDVIQLAIKFAEDDYEGNVTRYENLIHLNNDAMKYGGWTSTYSEYPGSVVIKMRSQGYQCEAVGNEVYCMVIKLNDSAIALRRNGNDEYRRKIEECKRKAASKAASKAAMKKAEELEKQRAEQQAKNEAYWAEHAEEKQQLKSESNTLQAQLRQLELQIAPFEIEITKWNKKKQEKTPAMKEKETLEKQAKELIERQANLGFFNIIEKKSIQTQIDEISARLPSINQSIENEKKEQIRLCNEKIREIEQQAKPIKDKIADAEKRISEINAALMKNR